TDGVGCRVVGVAGARRRADLVDQHAVGVVERVVGRSPRNAAGRRREVAGIVAGCRGDVRQCGEGGAADLVGQIDVAALGEVVGHLVAVGGVFGVTGAAALVA